MSKTISQREARQLRRKVEAYERMERTRRSGYTRDYPGGVNIAQTCIATWETSAIRTARMLGRAVVVTESNGTLLFYALPHPDMPA